MCPGEKQPPSHTCPHRHHPRTGKGEGLRELAMKSCPCPCSNEGAFTSPKQGAHVPIMLIDGHPRSWPQAISPPTTPSTVTDAPSTQWRVAHNVLSHTLKHTPLPGWRVRSLNKSGAPLPDGSPINIVDTAAQLEAVFFIMTYQTADTLKSLTSKGATFCAPGKTYRTQPRNI